MLAAARQLFMYLLKSAQPYAVIGLEQLTKGWNWWSNYKDFRGPWSGGSAAMDGRMAAACIKSHGRL